MISFWVSQWVLNVMTSVLMWDTERRRFQRQRVEQCRQIIEVPIATGSWKSKNTIFFRVSEGSSVLLALRLRLCLALWELISFASSHQLHSNLWGQSLDIYTEQSLTFLFFSGLISSPGTWYFQIVSSCVIRVLCRLGSRTCPFKGYTFDYSIRLRTVTSLDQLFICFLC